jgi:hypothetical protein
VNVNCIDTSVTSMKIVVEFSKVSVTVSTVGNCRISIQCNLISHTVTMIWLCCVATMHIKWNLKARRKISYCFSVLISYAGARARASLHNSRPRCARS